MTLWEQIKKFLLNLGLPMILTIVKGKGKDWAVAELQKIYVKDVKTYKRLVVLLYVGDDFLGDLSLKSDAKWDDDAVALVKQALTESAAANKFVLPDLSDTPLITQ